MVEIINLKSPITDDKFRKHAAPLYLLSVIGDLRFVIFNNSRNLRQRTVGAALRDQHSG
jgi:hypothetical protein